MDTECEIKNLATCQLSLHKGFGIGLSYILASKTLKVARVELGEDDDDRRWLADREGKLGIMVVNGPRNPQCRPLVCNRPCLIEESCSVEGLILPEQVLIADPECPIVAKAMIELDHPLRRPLLTAIRPSASPLTLAPRVLEKT